MVTDTPENLDVVAIAEDELVAAVQVLHVRRGRVVGRHGFIVEKVEPLTTPQLIGKVLEQHYAETPIGIPRELLVPELPEDVGHLRGVARRPPGREGHDAGSPCAAASVSCSPPPTRTPPTSSPVTGCGGPPTSRAEPRRSRSCKRPSG